MDSQHPLASFKSLLVLLHLGCKVISDLPSWLGMVEFQALPFSFSYQNPLISRSWGKSHREGLWAH